MNLLADFRNYQYMLPSIKGVTVHMEDKWTYINFPRNRYDQVRLIPFKMCLTFEVVAGDEGG
jgi:NADH:ubiquinone oxidoreductase subunit H